ncbi:MAG: substrate-binding domain-containing protein, partial [Oscillospiraceae bacterium]|nr:substrate-binding domain-containing protein [Oscillospiraceae bacterium]
MSKRHYLQVIAVIFACFLALVCLLHYDARIAGPKEKSIEIILKARQNPPDFWRVVEQGIIEASNEFGVQCNVTAPSRESDVERQIQLMEEAVSRRPDAIILAASDQERMVPVCQEAVEKGIILVTMDSDIAYEGRRCFVATDNYEMGKKLAPLIDEVAGRGGRFGVIAHVQSTSTAEQRRDGLLDTIENAGGRLAALEYCEGSEDLSRERATAMVLAHPEIECMVGLNESSSLGITYAVQDLGREGEIAVIARDTEPYQAPIETIFSRYHIPYFDDRRSDVVTHPLARGLLYALDAVQSGFESEYVLALSKSCLLGLSAEQGGLLENYCYVWNVTRKTWRMPFENHPDGLKDALNEEAFQRLAQANEARVYIMDHLLTLEEDLRDCDGKGFATAVYQYLLNIQAADHLRAAAEEMEPAEAKQLLEDGAQVWDALMGTLDIFGGVLETVRFPLNRFVDLFRLCIGNLQIGILPQTLDQVLIGNADRIRPAEPKAVFVLGLNEGKFPAWTGSSGLLTDGERERLRTAGVDLLHTAEQQALLESYYVYFALTRPSECLYLSYPSWDTAGKGMAKSSAILQAERIFGKTAEPSVSLSPMDRVWSEKSAFDLMARGWREATPEQAALREWFQSRQPKRYQALERVSGVHPFALQSEKGKALFAGDLRLSPSRLERYFLCPFSFFCESGLGLRPRRKAEYNPLESGTLIHLVLQQMVEKYGGKGLNSLDDARLREESAAFLDQALKARVNQDMPYRFQYLFARQVDTLAWLLRHLGQEFSQSAFAPVAMELQIREGSPYRPLKLPVFDGSRIIVEGVVDRLDAFEISKRRYLRVVDYKTGIKKFELGDICHGLNMQMLIYLFALCDCYGGLTASYNIPAGVLYMPARADVVEAKRETDPAKIKSMRDAQMKMNGLLLNDRAALSAMECGIK